MVSTAQQGVDLFAGQLPDNGQIRRLALTVNSSEINQAEFEQRVQQNLSNRLAAGIGYLILGKAAQALEYLHKAADCREKHLYLGQALAQEGQTDKALECIDKAAKHQADTLTTALTKAAILREAGRQKEAAVQLNNCQNFEKVSAEYHYQLGRLQDATGLYEQAMENYKTAVELDANHREALFHLAYASDLRGDEEAAIDYYKQLTKTAPVHINSLINLAILYEDRGNYDKAEKCIDTVLRWHPNHKTARLYKKDAESSRVMTHDEEKERLQDRQNKILEIPISDFELSVRSRNCLRKMNINKVGDLLRTSEVELLSYKNFGETSLMEIKKILDSKNLRLGMSLEEKNTAAIQAAGAAIGASEEVLKKPIEEIEFSVRVRRALNKLNIRTLGELITKTDAELLGCKNFGVTSLNEIKERLATFGLNLRKLE